MPAENKNNPGKPSQTGAGQQNQTPQGQVPGQRSQDMGQQGGNPQGQVKGQQGAGQLGTGKGQEAQDSQPYNQSETGQKGKTGQPQGGDKC